MFGMARQAQTGMMPDVSIDWIIEGLAKPGKTQVGLAEALHKSPQSVSRLVKGERRLIASEVPAIRAYLEVDPAETAAAETDALEPAEPAERPLVPLVGHVASGEMAAFHGEGQGPYGYVDPIEDSNQDTVAVRIRGDAMGDWFDQWLVYYDDIRRPPGSSMLNRLCVVGLEDGRVLIKKLVRGSARGLYTLHSQFGPPIQDVPVQWAALVKALVPR